MNEMLVHEGIDICSKSIEIINTLEKEKNKMTVDLECKMKISMDKKRKYIKPIIL